MYTAIYRYACIQSSPVHKASSRTISSSSSSPSSSSVDANGSSVSLLLSFSLAIWLVASEMGGQTLVNQHDVMLFCMHWQEACHGIKLKAFTNQGQHLFHWCQVSVWRLYEGSVYLRAAFNQGNTVEKIKLKKSEMRIHTWTVTLMCL